MIDYFHSIIYNDLILLGKLFPDLVSPIASISIPKNELNKISNKHALIIKPHQDYSGKWMKRYLRWYLST